MAKNIGKKGYKNRRGQCGHACFGNVSDFRYQNDFT